MGFAETLAAIQGVVDVGTSLFNVGSQIENTMYQRELQNKIFGREDSAVQRRMADLKAAGLNPNLAAGSAASSGSVVSTSAPQADFGNQLDKLAALSQLSLQKQQTENAKLENRILEYESFNRKMERNLNFMNYCQNLGIGLSYDGEDPSNIFFKNKPGEFDITDNTPIRKLFLLGLKNNENNAALLQNDLNFYKTDKYFNYGSQLINGVSAFGKLFK